MMVSDYSRSSATFFGMNINSWQRRIKADKVNWDKDHQKEMVIG